MTAPQKEPAGSEREAFEAWICTHEGHPFARQFANLMWATWQARASRPSIAAGEVPKPLDDPRLQQMFSDAIEGALALGYQNSSPPPDGHWLWRFWNIARASQPSGAAGGEVELTDDRLLELWGNAWDHPSRDMAIVYGRSVIAAVAPLASPSSGGWQPMESAPKDGRTLLLGYFNSRGKWRTLRGQWMSADYILENWEEPDDVEAGWFETSVESDDVPNCWATNPTFWQPMPTPPAPKSSGESHE